MEKKSPTEALRAALLSIPDGQVTETANAAGLALSQLLRMRRGENLDIKISTLTRLAQAMGRTTDELLGLREPSPNTVAEAALRKVAELMEERRKRLEREKERVEKQLAQLSRSQRET